jgi:hypothetical protein
VACPFFHPTIPIRDWRQAPRAPLGDPYEGVCRTEGGEWEPAGELLRECCNFGYARGRCARFPVTETVDAIRLTAWECEGGALELQYILEGNHEPLRHGRLTADAGSDLPGALHSQAKAFVSSYRRRRRQGAEAS